MKFKLLLSLLAGILLFGCASQQNSTQPMATESSQKFIDARLVENGMSAEPVLIGSNGKDLYVFSHNSRFYVVGSEEMAAKFKVQGHLPYTRTILGAGPKGETVVFEVNKKSPAFVEALQARYQNTPILIKAESSYWEWKFNNRIYVIGQEKTNQTFKSSHFLPYTRTILGAGPYGETVIFEVHKKDPSLTERLKETFGI